MIFACTQENLLQGLSLVSHVAGKNPNLPILGNVLIKTEGGSLKISTTNLEMAVSALVRGRVEEEGEFTVPVKLLQDYVSLLPDGKVELAVKDEALEVRADGKSTSIKGVAASEFPLIPKLAKDTGYKMNARALAEAIGQVVFAVSTSESRPELSGVACFFHGSAGHDRLVMAATDSYRLSERSMPLLPGGGSSEARCIVPARAMLEVARILSSYKDDVSMPEEVGWSITESQFVLTYGQVELISRLIEGSFPDYRQIIPQRFKTKMVVPRTEVLRAIRAASLFARQGLYDVLLELGGDGTLKISSADTGKGAHTTTLKVEADPEPNKVTLNFKYVSDGLSALGGEKIQIRMIDGMNPVVVTPADSSCGEEFQYVVMPIRQ
ncbi:MAG TPA: DNA polymerase III subunit beta [Patescibacteria group bacterium]|nr:DNA polymerase III subunit beta [Patescibacteria group bacterium]